MVKPLKILEKYIVICSQIMHEYIFIAEHQAPDA